MTKYTVTFTDLIRACRKAYDEKRLGAQIPYSESNGRCLYVYPARPDCGCAIGVGLPQAFRTELLNGGPNGCRVAALVLQSAREGVSAFDIEATEEQRNELSMLQSSHDNWVPDKPSAPPRTELEHIICEQRFLNQLSSCEALCVAA